MSAQRAIGLDGRCLDDHHPGIGRYVYGLTQALATHASDAVAVHLRLPDGVDPARTAHPPGDRLRRFPLAPLRAAGVQLRADDAIDLDLWHRPSPLMMRAARGIAQVVSIHDALPLVPAAGFTAGARWLWRQRARRAARTAARVQTLSETARGALVRGLRLDPARIDGVGAGVDVDPPVRAATLPDALPQRYVLHVGARRPHKRIGFLLDAWESLVRRERTAGHGLVLAGPRGRSTPQLRTQAERAGLLGLRRAIADRAGRPGAATVFAHDPDDAELDALYRGASLLVMPSLVEGFGLPLAEAMARDVAVVCADGPGMTEVVGDAGVRFLPRSVGDLVQQLDDLLHDDDARAALVVRGRARVERHAWPRVAERTLASYRRALGDG